MMAEFNIGSNSDNNKRKTKMKQIAAALVKAQKEFGPAIKSKTNPLFKSLYVSLDACIAAVIDALNNNNIMLTQATFECDDGVIVETVFLHESGEMYSAGKLHVPANKQDAQGYGSALTYARRYSLMTATGLAGEDDDGNAASKGKNAAPSKLSAEQVKEIVSMANDVGVQMDTICKFAKVEKIEDAQLLAYEPIIKKLNEKRNAK